jgi:hypothetical protein
MPLAFDSLSHGSIAFGFFNIESDMLLCERYFLFADVFCNYVENLVENAGGNTYQTRWQVRFIDTPEAIGDLMGAIHGVHYTGFIGDLYRRFPFPQNTADFKQNPRGDETQTQVSEIIAGYARVLEIVVVMPSGGREIKIGEYEFNRSQFQELIKYVWRGGYPRWKNEIRPAYVTALKNKILKHSKGIFKGMELVK